MALTVPSHVPNGTTHLRLTQGPTLEFYKVDDPHPKTGLGIRTMSMWVQGAWVVQTGFLPWDDLIAYTPDPELVHRNEAPRLRFNRLAIPMIEFVRAHGSPHTTVIINNESAELLQGSMGFTLAQEASDGR